MGLFFANEKSATVEQKRERIIWICMEKMVEMIRQKTQGGGLCPALGVCFDYPGSSNIGVLRLELSTSVGSPYMCRVGVYRTNTDMLISNYMKSGTLDDIIAYLSDRANLQEMASSYQHLSASVDERW